MALKRALTLMNIQKGFFTIRIWPLKKRAMEANGTQYNISSNMHFRNSKNVKFNEDVGSRKFKT
jgi:hypothetical protein